MLHEMQVKNDFCIANAWNLMWAVKLNAPKTTSSLSALYQMDEVKKISDWKFQYPLSNSSPCKKSRLKINIYEAEQKAIYYVCLWYNMQNSG